MFFLSTQRVPLSHLSELQTQYHLGKGPLKEIIEGSHDDNSRAVLASTSTDVVPDLPPGSGVALARLVDLKTDVVQRLGPRLNIFAHSQVL